MILMLLNPDVTSGLKWERSNVREHVESAWMTLQSEKKKSNNFSARWFLPVWTFRVINAGFLSTTSLQIPNGHMTLDTDNRHTDLAYVAMSTGWVELTGWLLNLPPGLTHTSPHHTHRLLDSYTTPSRHIAFHLLLQHGWIWRVC